MRRVLMFVLLAGCTPDSAPAPKSMDYEFPIEAEVLPVKDASVDAPVPDASLPKLGSFRTQYSVEAKDSARAWNIEHAALYLLQTRVEAGEQFSFNDVVGERSEKRGFRKAPTLFLGEVLEDVGGGVCQVSSTVHAAAIFSGLEVVSRLSHSRRSKYIQPGLDSTVAFGPRCFGDHRANDVNGKNPDCYAVDLVLRNPFDHPVVLHMSTGRADGEGWVEAAWLGSDPKGEITYGFKLGAGEDFKKTFRKAPYIRSAGYRKRKQSGQPGMNVYSTVSPLQGEKSSWNYVSRYQPVNEIWVVGRDYDMEGPPPWEPTLVDAGTSEVADAAVAELVDAQP